VKLETNKDMYMNLFYEKEVLHSKLNKLKGAIEIYQNPPVYIKAWTILL